MTRETVEQFLARGQKITYLPVGLCNWDALTDRAKINPSIDYAERKARKAAEKALAAPAKPERPAPRPKAPKPPKTPKPPKVAKVREPEPPRPRRAPKAKIAPPGSHKARLLALLETGWQRVADLHAATGIGKGNIREHLSALLDKGMVEATGTHIDRQWRRAIGEAGEPKPPVVKPPTGQMAEVLEAIRAGHVTARDIAAATGQSPVCVRTRLYRLKQGGWAKCRGSTQLCRWTTTDAPAW